MTEVTIGGESREIRDFSAFKALVAGDLIASGEAAYRRVLSETAQFKRGYEGENYVEMDRAEARYEFRPRALSIRNVIHNDDGTTVENMTPQLVDGHPVVGPDPLGHLTEDDWQHSGQKLRIHNSPGRQLEIAAMVPIALREARALSFRLVALVLTSNAELERWDSDGDDVEAKLDAEAKRLQHRATLAEIVDLSGVVIRSLRDQLVGPFDRARAEWREAFNTTTPETEDDRPEAPVVPMRLEPVSPDESMTSSPTSSSSSEDDSDGTPSPSPTGSDGASSSASASG